MSLRTGSVSWWETNGPGCKSLFLSNHTETSVDDGGTRGSDAPWRPLRPHLITGCLIPYHILEITQASIHIVLAVRKLFLFFSFFFSQKITIYWDLSLSWFQIPSLTEKIYYYKCSELSALLDYLTLFFATASGGPLLPNHLSFHPLTFLHLVKAFQAENITQLPL